MEEKNFFDWYLNNNTDIKRICEAHIDFTCLNNHAETEIITICFRWDYWEKVAQLIEAYFKELNPTITNLNELGKAINCRDCIFFRFVKAFEKHYGEKDFSKLSQYDQPYLYLQILDHGFTLQWSAQILFCEKSWKDETISDGTPFEDMYDNFRGEFFQYLESKLNAYKDTVLSSLLCNEEENKHSSDPAPAFNNNENYKDFSKEDYIFCKKIQADNISGYIFQLTDY